MCNNAIVLPVMSTTLLIYLSSLLCPTCSVLWNLVKVHYKTELQKYLNLWCSDVGLTLYVIRRYIYIWSWSISFTQCIKPINAWTVCGYHRHCNLPHSDYVSKALNLSSLFPATNEISGMYLQNVRSKGDDWIILIQYHLKLLVLFVQFSIC